MAIVRIFFIYLTLFLWSLGGCLTASKLEKTILEPAVKALSSRGSMNFCTLQEGFIFTTDSNKHLSSSSIPAPLFLTSSLSSSTTAAPVLDTYPNSYSQTFSSNSSSAFPTLLSITSPTMNDTTTITTTLSITTTNTYTKPTTPSTTATTTLTTSTTPTTNTTTTTTIAPPAITMLTSPIFPFPSTNPSIDFLTLHQIIENYDITIQLFDSLFPVLRTVNQELKLVWRNKEKFIFAFEGSQIKSPTTEEMSRRFHEYFESFSELITKLHDLEVKGKLAGLELDRTLFSFYNNLRRYFSQIHNTRVYEKELLAATSGVFLFFTTAHLMGINEEDHQLKIFLEPKEVDQAESALLVARSLEKTSVTEESLVMSLAPKFLPSLKKEPTTDSPATESNKKNLQINPQTVSTEPVGWQRIIYQVRSIYDIVSRLRIVLLMSKEIIGYLDGSSIEELEELLTAFVYVEEFSFMHHIRYQLGNDRRRLPSFWMRRLVGICLNLKEVAITLEATVEAVPIKLSSIVSAAMPMLIQEIQKQRALELISDEDYQMQGNFISLLKNIIQLSNGFKN